MTGKEVGWAVSVWLFCDVLRPECHNYTSILSVLKFHESHVGKDRPKRGSKACAHGLGLGLGPSRWQQVSLCSHRGGCIARPLCRLPQRIAHVHAEEAAALCVKCRVN